MFLQIFAALGAALLTFALTKLYIGWAEAGKRLDVPNERSSHEKPVPVGGGIAILTVAGLLWVLLAMPSSPLHWALFAGAALLAFVSWLDDHTPLPAPIRLAAQFAAIAFMLWLLPGDLPVLPFGLPIVLDRIITALAWVWFVNLFNFMDGMDGLAGGETLTIAAGLALLSMRLPLHPDTALLPFLLAGAAIGFLCWNWHPAKVFMGDVGSVPLGFVLGWLLIELSISGFFIAALILPLYFVTDATLTLAARARRGEKLWQAHKTHFYQRAHQAGYSHEDVVARIMAANVFLVLLSLSSLNHPFISLLLAIATVAGLLVILQRMADRA